MACFWDQDSTGCWTTDCGKLFEFNDGTPKENGAKFCLYCGQALRQRSYRDPSHRKGGAPKRGSLTACDMK